ncbi:transposase [Alloyangia pacifica]|uniref:transposase n=1 Tax=Alloyangia pacifica TaxID=311180 RepID=UPI0015A4CA00
MGSDHSSPKSIHTHWEELFKRLPREGVSAVWPTEAACRTRFIEVRWPDGVTCPACASKETGHLGKRHTFYCKACRHQFSAQSGSVAHRSHVALQLWFVAAEMIIRSRANFLGADGPSGHDLKDRLGISYSAAYKLKKLIVGELLQPGGGLVGECILTKDTGDGCEERPRTPEDEIKELEALILRANRRQ